MTTALIRRPSAESLKTSSFRESGTSSMGPHSVPYEEVLRFMCAHTLKSMDCTVGYEFTGADYCTVLRACCPTLLDRADVCRFSNTVPKQAYDNLDLFLASCAALELDTFPSGLTPSSLEPSVEHWTNHALVQAFLYRVATAHMTPLSNVEHDTTPGQMRCDSGVVQLRAAVKGEPPGACCNSQELTSQRGSASNQGANVNADTSCSVHRSSQVHTREEHLEPDQLLRCAKGHLVQQAQLREYRRVLRHTHRQLIHMQAQGTGAVDWETLRQCAAIGTAYEQPAYV